MKTLEELTGIKSSWDKIEQLMAKATNNYEILPKDNIKAKEALINLGIGVDDLIGAVTYETGGILFDNGWLRLFGGGSEKLTRTVYSWNIDRSYESGEEPGFLMVADDIIGGIFAINIDALGDDKGGLYYLAPDTVEWEALETDYEGLLEFCFTGEIQDFYAAYRWNNWQEEIKKVNGDDAIMIIPPLWAEGPDDITERDREVLSMDEMFAILVEASELLSGEFEDEHDCGCDDDCCGNDCDCEGGEHHNCGHNERCDYNDDKHHNHSKNCDCGH